MSIRPKLEHSKKWRRQFFLLYFCIESLCLQRSTLLTYPTCSSRLPCRCVWQHSKAKVQFRSHVTSSVPLWCLLTAPNDPHTKHAVHNKTSHANTHTLYHFQRKTLQQQKHTHTHKQNTNNYAHFRFLQSEWFGSVLRKYARARRMLASWPTSKSACYRQGMLLL